MELEIIKALQAVDSKFFEFFCKFITYMASYLGFFLIFFLIYFLYNKRYSLYFAITYGIGVLLNYILKAIIDKPRPYETYSEIINKLPAAGASFPSGHCVSATIIVAFLIVVVFSKVKNKWLTALCIFLLFGFLTLTVVSRMYLGQHYLSDTLAGIAVGAMVALGGLLCYREGKSRKE